VMADADGGSMAARSALRVALVYVGGPESPARPVMSPPVGTQLLGSLLLAHGYPVRIYDTRLQPPELLRGALAELDPRIVGLSFLSPSAADAVALARELRADGRFVIAGGVHASIHTRTLLELGVVDCVVRGEGEHALLDICAAMASGGWPPPVVEGRPFDDMDLLPDYADFECYRGLYNRPERFLPAYVQIGRGCPMKCTFCELPNRAVFAPPRRRFKSVDRVLAEIRTYVARWGVNFVTLVDSIATLNLPLITELVRRMDAELPRVGLMFNGHVNRFNRALAEQIGLAQEGRRDTERISVWFGFESGSQRLLDLMRKETTVEKGVAVAALCREYDVQLGANLLLGVPTETPDDYARHHDFMATIAPTFPNPNILNPLPGTEMYDYCTAHALLRDPADCSIWTHTDIAERGHGPVVGVDYDLVLDAYYRYREDERPDADLLGPPRHQPWAAG